MGSGEFKGDYLALQVAGTCMGSTMGTIPPHIYPYFYRTKPHILILFRYFLFVSLLLSCWIQEGPCYARPYAAERGRAAVGTATENEPENKAPAAWTPNQSTMKTIYLFSGLGADYRAFENIELPGYKLVHIRWVEPAKEETMEQYAQRLTAQITTENPILIGLSFGGMMAVEVSKLIATEKIILISSAKTKGELAAGQSFFLKTGLYKYLPGSMITGTNFMVYRLFGARSVADKTLLAAIMEDTDPRFFRWAMKQMAHWQNETVPPNLIHIHGTADKIIPYDNVKADQQVCE